MHARALLAFRLNTSTTFSAHFASHPNVFGLDAGALTMYGLKVGVLKEADQVALQRLRHDPDGGGIVPQTRTVDWPVLGNLRHDSGEGKEGQAQAGSALLTSNHP